MSNRLPWLRTSTADRTYICGTRRVRLAPVYAFPVGDSKMESSRAARPVSGATVLTRVLCLVILLLMTIASGYGGYIALRNFRHIGV